MRFDIVIVGGGLSGLALAAELARPEFSKLQVLVLEKRKNYIRDRTWSYWSASHRPAHRYSHLERCRWSRWCVRDDSAAARQAVRSVTKKGKTQTYCSLDSDVFYLEAQHAISQSNHVTLRLNVMVRQIVGGDTPSVEMTDGEVIRASWVFDARPPLRNEENILVQQFVGYEIKTDYDVFDPTTVELMHFHPSTRGLHFFYVLPYSARNALVETTWISSASFKPNFTSELAQFFANSLGCDKYELVYEEKGLLDLSLCDKTPSNSSHVVLLGRGAGILRRSTGYAFLDTLSHVEKIAVSLENHLIRGELKNWVPIVFRRRAIDEWMDTVFLKVLERDWAKGSLYFMELFRRLDADALVAFLSGKASWRERLLVSSALPTVPFVAQAIATVIDRVSKLWRGGR
jgi:lycopene beta-cyclase